MKRKITELEEKLIQHGFKLKSKKYGGKNSEFIDSYLYSGNILKEEDGLGTFVDVVLNQKRDKVIDIRVPCIVHYEYITKEIAQHIYSLVDLVEKYIEGIVNADN